ncbi:MAG: hypothetical protein V9E81_03090 [Marmoricola sp.]
MSLRVMVVDDHPMWRDAVERDLVAAGLTVVASAANGTEALARAKTLFPTWRLWTSRSQHPMVSNSLVN